MTKDMRRQAVYPDGGIRGSCENHIYYGGREERDVGETYVHPRRRYDHRSPQHPGVEPRQGQIPHAQGHESRAGHVDNIRGHPKGIVSGGADGGDLDQDMHACPQNEETNETALAVDKGRPTFHNPRRFPMDLEHESKNSDERATQSRDPGTRHTPRHEVDGKLLKEGNHFVCSWSREDTGYHAGAAHMVTAAVSQGVHGARLHQANGTFPNSVATVGANRTSMMHNPVDAEELARVRAKKDAYRRDLEAQLTEQRKRLKEPKEQEGGSKESEVRLLQQAMEREISQSMIPPGYKMGPLGVPVFKDVKSGSRNEQMAATQLRTRKDVNTDVGTPETIGTCSPDPGKATLTYRCGSKGQGTPSPMSKAPSKAEVGGGAAVGCFEVPLVVGGSSGQRRGQGLRDLLGGTEEGDEEERERCRRQAEALKQQLEDNRARRDSQKMQLEQEKIKEETRVQREREELRKRFEEESKIAKALEAEKLLKEAEDAKRAAEGMKDAAEARRREDEIRDDARVERERIELDQRYASERAREEPLKKAIAKDVPLTPRVPWARTSPDEPAAGEPATSSRRSPMNSRPGDNEADDRRTHSARSLRGSQTSQTASEQTKDLPRGNGVQTVGHSKDQEHWAARDASGSSPLEMRCGTALGSTHRKVK